MHTHDTHAHSPQIPTETKEEKKSEKKTPAEARMDKLKELINEHKRQTATDFRTLATRGDLRALRDIRNGSSLGHAARLKLEKKRKVVGCTRHAHSHACLGSGETCATRAPRKTPQAR